MVWKNLEINKKTTPTYALNFKKDGIPVDITGWTIYFTVKENISDSDANAVIKKDIDSHDEPLNGIALIKLEATDTDLTPKTYYYDVFCKDDDENMAVLFRGNLTIIETITTRQ